MAERQLDWLKPVARLAAVVVVSPAILSFRLGALVLGRDRALEGTSQALALLPGLTGQYLRNAFLRHALEYCHPSVLVQFGTTFSKAGARLGENVYIGPACHIGLADVGADALIGAGVHVPSGPRVHGIEDLDTPIREQPGCLKVVRIGAGSWVGSGAIVMADVGEQTVVAAGSVVTRALPDRVVAAGVPASVIRHRGAGGAAEGRSDGHAPAATPRGDAVDVRPGQTANTP